MGCYQMSDILIRNVDDVTLARIDGQAARLGLSRNEYLRRQLDALANPRRTATMDDLRGSVELSVGVLDADLMRQAWE